ncbi:SGNH/GDSL hydrolase family protein [Actinomadura rayongensis]|uniref:SGNH/GDSL hydrolase family protein n=1 Tax=Actinomadura rayongensis TaxID=1429076 RepID=A0A6I4WG33_9ACTN|nr:SGNH/GDSL hydrolase family protein [Actinomadura rayongensis]MXQ65552.1 SGNH/GDSL hydrolase family protein [Actinomadura rayongensis]
MPLTRFPRFDRRSAALGLSLLLPLALTTPLPSANAAAPAPGRFEHGWVGTWSASAQAPWPSTIVPPFDPTVAGFDGQTVREIVHTSAGGSAVRIHLSNAFGTKPLVIGHATVGVDKGEAALDGPPAKITFAGADTVTIPVGKEIVSDPVPLRVAPLTDLAVSLFLPEATGPTTQHSYANQINYISKPGDHTGEADGGAFFRPVLHWFFLSSVDVRSPGTPAVVALGDGTTDGVQAAAEPTNNRWTDVLARRLAERGRPAGVLNEGILRNRLLNGSPCFGRSALDRLDSDVFDRTGVRSLIVLDGVSDIGFPALPDFACLAPRAEVTARQLIDGYRQIIARAHARGIRVIGGTLPPLAGSDYDSPANERTRQAVNAWIRHGHGFDAVVDFDRVLRDPADPHRLLPAYDSGDHLHPNGDGYEAMGRAVDLHALF